MSQDTNFIIVAGRLTRDPSLKELGANQICNISLAVNRSVKLEGEWKNEAMFLDCTAWNKTAENISRFARKGNQIMVQGSLVEEKWDGKDGEKKSKFKIKIDNFQLFGNKNEIGGKENNNDVEINSIEDIF